MSGLYIPCLEMPKDGAFVEVLIWSDGHVTKTGDSYFAEDGKHYYKACNWEYYNAISVPDHGRLIDADFIVKRLRKQIQEVGEDTELANRDREFISVIGAVSTIIPASKEGEK